MSARSQRTGLWGHADFLRLWAAQAISAFGSRITRTALPIIAVNTLGEPEAVIAVLGALQMAPAVIVAPFAGGWVDRSRKRPILIAADLFRAAVVASLTITWIAGVLGIVQVIAVGMLVGAASALFQITDVAYLPFVVGRSQLAEGNAKLETTEAIAEITGPASAGVLIWLLGAPLAVVVNVASYLWSAFMLGRIEKVETAPEPNPDAMASTGWQSSKDMRVGMRAIFGHPQVRPIVIALMVWAVAGGFFVALYAVLCLRTLGLPESTYGVIVAMGGIGSLAGALVSRRLAGAIGVGRTMIVTAALSTLSGLFMAVAPYASSYTLVLVFLGAHQLLGDGFQVAFYVQAVTLRQTVLPKHVLGRANAALLLLTIGVHIIAALAAGTLAQLTNVRLAVWIGSVIGLAVPFCLLPLRHLRDMPAADASSPGFAPVAHG
ncbi:MAG: MFS transporter [Acidobacteriota bacterium]